MPVRRERWQNRPIRLVVTQTGSRARAAKRRAGLYGLALRSRAAVWELVARRWGACLVVRTMGTDLTRWGFTAQKPLRRAYEQDPAEVRRWPWRDYPAVVARAAAIIVVPGHVVALDHGATSSTTLVTG
jgi:hypothetical protein